MLPLWPHVTTCCQVIPNPRDIWQPVTRWYLICKELWEAQKGNLSQPNLVSMNACGHCNHIWPPVTHSSYPLQLLTPVTQVTHFSYSSYPFQLFQLPPQVTPVTHSSYSSYPLQIPTPVTPFIQSSHPLKLLQLPIPVIPITNSSYPIYYKHPKFQPDHW